MGYTIDAAIRAASREVGTRETGTNNVKYNRWLGQLPGYPHNGYGYPWCASFQSWVADKAGGRAGVDYPRTAGCAAAVSWFKSHGRWSSVPHVGDWVLYGPGGTTHVELVIGVTARHITTIGGNTSGSLNGAYYNGDGVYKKQITRSSSRIYGYGRPVYGAEEEDDMQLNDSVPVGNTYDRDFRHDHYPVSFVMIGAFAEAKRARIASEANGAAVAELVRTVAQLAADRGQAVDADALVQRIEQAIERVTVRLDVQPDEQDAS